MLLTDARRPARTDADGELVPLAEQDRTLLGPRRASPRARRCSTTPSAQGAVGEYQLQAAIAAVHDRAARGRATPTGRRSWRCTACWSG